MLRRSKIKVRLVNLGVDIIDHNGTMLAGITEQDAIDLLAALRRLMPKIKARAKVWK